MARQLSSVEKRQYTPPKGVTLRPPGCEEEGNEPELTCTQRWERLESERNSTDVVPRLVEANAEFTGDSELGDSLDTDASRITTLDQRQDAVVAARESIAEIQQLLVGARKLCTHPERLSITTMEEVIGASLEELGDYPEIDVDDTA